MKVEHIGRPNIVFHWIGVLFFKLFGWEAVGRPPDVPKFIAVVAYHTSQWDFFMLMAFTFVIRVKANWVAKHTLFRPPLGWVMRALGGIPIDRRRAHGVVGEAVRAINARDRVILAITPEGTRSYTPYWRTGFHQIARGANVPMVPCFIDFKRKRAGISSVVVYPTDDPAADLEKMRPVWEDITPRHPENAGPVCLKGANSVGKPDETGEPEGKGVPEP